MATLKRARGGPGVHSFAARVPFDIYTSISEWAWENRLTLTAACSELLQKAIKAEHGEKYIPNSTLKNSDTE